MQLSHLVEDKPYNFFSEIQIVVKNNENSYHRHYIYLIKMCKLSFGFLQNKQLVMEKDIDNILAKVLERFIWYRTEGEYGEKPILRFIFIRGWL